MKEGHVFKLFGGFYSKYDKEHEQEVKLAISNALSIALHDMELKGYIESSNPFHPFGLGWYFHINEDEAFKKDDTV